ncbi:malonate decarboxylase holo-ACP synthase [Caballeronia sp. BR00000012568055]|uniref:malonate decarboxylase holo-ACP synthase n=1 Tax=Caballeronia sp. BR00000012568055 TaxID=2918761 RepID=UPI0023F886F0|nr:malonate decarboxylase holo-ACP synthase [Caballeronia sp. BR00000012568055]
MRPHDLLRIASDAPPFDDAPAWVAAALERAPFVVVRRAPVRVDAIGIGIRGASRNERFGTWLDPRYVAEVFTPESLSKREADPVRARLPAFALLRATAKIIDETGLDWGPAGSTGFELASSIPTVTPTSDLDLVIRAPDPLSHDDACKLFDALSQAARTENTRIDVQIETPDAAFSLAEFARTNLRVMLRHANGPRLATDPWAAR